MRIACIVLGALALSGCGSGAGTPSGSNAPPESAPAAGGTIPPPAYIEFGEPGHWMSRGSSCWSSGGVAGCLDAASPENDPNLPELIVGRGATGRIHLGFDPSSAHLTVGGLPVRVHAGRTITFTAHRPGIVLLDVDQEHGSASYDARLRFARD
jgi:hypothetical protein